MTDRLQALIDGVLGRFWALDADPRPIGPLDQAEAVSGQLQLVEGVVQVKTQRPAARSVADLHSLLSGLDEGADPAPRWLFGTTELGSVVVPVVTGETTTQSLSGDQVSTRTYRGPTIAVSVGDATGPRLTRLAVDLPFAGWAGFEPMTRRARFDSKQRWDALEISLQGTEEQPCGRIGPVALSLRGGWTSTEEEQGHLTSVGTALQVITASRRPLGHADHVDIVMGVQDLLSLAYGQFLPASRAHAVLEGNQASRTSTWFYHRSLVESASPTRAATRGRGHDAQPLFRLDDLGGPAAVARWVSLNRRYPDAANAVRVRDRPPTINPTRRTIELGAAIEQYVATVKIEARQAGRSVPHWVEAEIFETALARHAGSAFAGYVGDPDAWAQIFHAAYLREKHPMGDRRPINELVALSSSAQLLLIVTLLNQAARSQRPGRVLLDDFRLAGLGETIRHLVAAAPAAESPRRIRRRRKTPAPSTPPSPPPNATTGSESP